jgi:hypothetical protein
VKKEPVYCSGNNPTSSTTLELLIKENSLTASDWKTNSLGGFYFDCDTNNKDFKLDPVKVEKGKYSEQQMKLVGNSKGSCCNDKIAFEVDLDAPRV